MTSNEVLTFPKGISLKTNIKAWLVFELAYYDVAIQHVNHYAKRTPPNLILHTLKQTMEEVIKDESSFISCIKLPPSS